MSSEPNIIKGNSFLDERGKITFNNDFNAAAIKRIYFITNHSLDFIRGWQGHQIEQRWFMSVKGTFEIKVIKIDNWDKPSNNLNAKIYQINADNADVLHVPNGFVTSIQALQEDSKLMAMSDYTLGAIKDEYRFAINHFEVSD